MENDNTVELIKGEMNGIQRSLKKDVVTQTEDSGM